MAQLKAWCLVPSREADKTDKNETERAEGISVLQHNLGSDIHHLCYLPFVKRQSRGTDHITEEGWHRCVHEEAEMIGNRFRNCPM